MNINTSILHVGNIEALVVRKDIKNLHLSVLPPLGKIRVSAPIAMKDDAVRALIATRLGWIKKQQEKFRNQERQTPREYVSGETHYFWGKKYRMEVIYEKEPQGVILKGKSKILLSVKPKSDFDKRERVVQDWYRNQLRSVAKVKIEYWRDIIGVSLNEWKIKKMKTRWGTCNTKAGRIWINLELVKKPEHCLDFIIVHELTHLLERKHNDKFKAYMDKFLPKWRQYKEELNRAVLSYERWEY